MFGFLRNRAANDTVTEAGVALDELIEGVLDGLGVDFPNSTRLLRAAQVVVCETFAVENPQLTEQQRTLIMRISGEVRNNDPKGIALIVDSIYAGCQATNKSLDDYLAAATVNDMFRRASDGPIRGAPEFIAAVAAAKWAILYALMASRMLLATAVGDRPLQARIQHTLSQLQERRA